ncbi:MAG: heavy-metal-associated domain-containing protein [Candidatus Brocadiaceae bacterium]|nr:heavy-metal-associated domain-containing protein [Candidatus Brocadiaceae bacterium]
MRKGLSLIQIAFVAITVFLTPSLAQAQIYSLSVVVEGMSCPFCVYGVEKRLTTVEGVKSVTISMNDGVATLIAKEERSVNINQVTPAVRDSGFTPGMIKIAAVGKIKVNEKQRFVLLIHGVEQNFILSGVKDTVKENLLSYTKSGNLVEIHGTVNKQPDEAWTLSPDHYFVKN